MALNSAVTDTKWSPNFSSGRPAGTPNVIVIHHWGVDGQSHQNVVNFLCTPRGDKSTSAHYVASAGRVTQLVHDYDRAQHAGPSGNPRGIGIECRPEMSAADFETVAQLVAAIRKEWGNLPLKGHQNYMQTACPGRWYPKLGELSARADAILAGKPVSNPAPAVKPIPAPAQKPATTSAFVFGPICTKLWQNRLGTQADGVVSRQPPLNRKFVVNPTTFQFTPAFTGGSSVVLADQKKLSKLGYYTGNIDGWCGPKQILARATYLANLGYYTLGNEDEYWSPKHSEAFYNALKAGRY